MRYRFAGPVVLLVAMSLPAAGRSPAQHLAANPDPHLRVTPVWPAQPGDAARADSIVAIARAALGKYRDVREAEQDGYRRFAPDVPNQRVYHYNRLTAMVKARFTFDPEAPSSLFYRDDGAGRLRLVGVMYTASSSATPEELNQRIPLSVARWHRHTNLCLPPAGQPRESLTQPGAQFGFQGTITTRAACEAAGGRFREAMFGWMMHINLFEPGPGGPWQDHRGGMRHP